MFFKNLSEISPPCWYLFAEPMRYLLNPCKHERTSTACLGRQHSACEDLDSTMYKNSCGSLPEQNAAPTLAADLKAVGISQVICRELLKVANGRQQRHQPFTDLTLYEFNWANHEELFIYQAPQQKVCVSSSQPLPSFPPEQVVPQHPLTGILTAW